VSDTVMEFENAVRALRVLREQKLREVEQIEMSLANFTALLESLPEMQAKAAALGVVTDVYAGMSIPKAAGSFLELNREPASTRDIAEALLKGGIKTTSRNFESLVYTTLVKSTTPKFKRTPDGRGWWIEGKPLPNLAWGEESSTKKKS
jgi:hypothetical protein